MRLFAAIRPSPQALEHLDSALHEVRADAGLSLRWTDPEQWHLTLAFHPALPEGAIPGTFEDLAHAAAQHAPMTLQLSGAGMFSGRTLWIGVGGHTARLTALMGEELLGGEERERRRAHLTVARVSARAPRAPRRRRGEERPPDPSQLALSRAVHALSVYRGPSWEAEEVELLSSHLGQGRSGGPRHELLGSVPLGG
ncbi:MAG TPA: RNA 2',3'-cyclic phosphodiesterase [Brachybacterium massiliense]|uniref:RNA 2',3'-cyclic phosphodiesterase n=1 Tax=Brachybacterium massiliense TaxID=1755098 RepID=A0A921MW48_9MICO|nr:RNA 2',3'-cyclic phosphodiesterase [Brachybacterium massiliense]